MNLQQESIAIGQRPRDYAGLLWIFIASAVGFGLFCATSAVALSDQTLPTPIVIQAGDIANLAFSNLNTAAALTSQAFADFISTPTQTTTQTASPTETPTSTFTLTPSRTPFVFATRTDVVERPTVIPTNTFIPKTSTPIPPPTNTAVTIHTFTVSPTQADPPTDTPAPPPTNPPPTNPPPTDPPPTNTSGP